MALDPWRPAGVPGLVAANWASGAPRRCSVRPSGGAIHFPYNVLYIYIYIHTYIYIYTHIYIIYIYIYVHLYCEILWYVVMASSHHEVKTYDLAPSNRAIVEDMLCCVHVCACRICHFAVLLSGACPTIQQNRCGLLSERAGHRHREQGPATKSSHCLHWNGASTS